MIRYHVIYSFVFALQWGAAGVVGMGLRVFHFCPEIAGLGV